MVRTIKQPTRGSLRSTKKVEKPVKEVEADYKLYQSYIKSKEFKELRAKMLERDGYRCRCCGRTLQDLEGTNISLQAHHRSYENVGKNNDEELADLITLCSVCHKGIHSARSNFHRFKDKHYILDNIKDKP